MTQHTDIAQSIIIGAWCVRQTAQGNTDPAIRRMHSRERFCFDALLSDKTALERDAIWQRYIKQALQMLGSQDKYAAALSMAAMLEEENAL